jgi:hypothetical protein
MCKWHNGTDAQNYLQILGLTLKLFNPSSVFGGLKFYIFATWFWL